MLLFFFFVVIFDFVLPTGCWGAWNSGRGPRHILEQALSKVIHFPVQRIRPLGRKVLPDVGGETYSGDNGTFLSSIPLLS